MCIWISYHLSIYFATWRRWYKYRASLRASERAYSHSWSLYPMLKIKLIFHNHIYNQKIIPSICCFPVRHWNLGVLPWTSDRKNQSIWSHRGPVSQKCREFSCQNAIHLLWKAELLTCFQWKKIQEHCKVWWLGTLALRRCKGIVAPEISSKKFWTFEKQAPGIVSDPKRRITWVFHCSLA